MGFNISSPVLCLGPFSASCHLLKVSRGKKNPFFSSTLKRERAIPWLGRFQPHTCNWWTGNCPLCYGLGLKGGPVGSSVANGSGFNCGFTAYPKTGKATLQTERWIYTEYYSSPKSTIQINNIINLLWFWISETKATKKNFPSVLYFALVLDTFHFVFLPNAFHVTFRTLPSVLHSHIPFKKGYFVQVLTKWMTVKMHREKGCNHRVLPGICVDSQHSFSQKGFLQASLF